MFPRSLAFGNRVAQIRVIAPAGSPVPLLEVCPMPSLKSQVDEAFNNLRAHRGDRGIRSKYVKRTPLRIMAMDRDLIALWAMHRGWSDAVAARESGLSPSTFNRARRRFEHEPWQLFRVPILHRGIRGGRPLWRCEVCDSRMLAVSERRAREHVALHLISQLAIETWGVMPPRN